MTFPLPHRWETRVTTGRHVHKRRPQRPPKPRSGVGWVDRMHTSWPWPWLIWPGISLVAAGDVALYLNGSLKMLAWVILNLIDTRLMTIELRRRRRIFDERVERVRRSDG